MSKGRLETPRTVEKWDKAKKREEPQSQLLVITLLSVKDLHPIAEKRKTARRLVGGREGREDDMQAMHGIDSCPPCPLREQQG